MEKKILREKSKEIDRLLKLLAKEEQMLDDHGETIVGRRDRPPYFTEPKKKKA